MSRKSFLIVDGDKAALDQLERYLLMEAAHKVYTATAPLAALRILQDRRTPVDCVICPNKHGKISGLEFLENLRAGRWGASLRDVAFVLTMKTKDESAIRRADDFGANAYLIGEIDRTSAIDTITKAVSGLETESPLKRYNIAHVRVGGADVIFVPMGGDFLQLSDAARAKVLDAIGVATADSRLAGQIIPVWETPSGAMGFVAPTAFHQAVSAINMDFVRANTNRTISLSIELPFTSQAKARRYTGGAEESAETGSAGGGASSAAGAAAEFGGASAGSASRPEFGGSPAARVGAASKPEFGGAAAAKAGAGAKAEFGGAAKTRADRRTGGAGEFSGANAAIHSDQSFDEDQPVYAGEADRDSSGRCMTHEDIGKVILAFRQLGSQNFLKAFLCEQQVAERGAGNALVPVMHEYFFSIDRIRKALFADVDLRKSAKFMSELTLALDQAIMRSIGAVPNSSTPFSINLNVQSVFTPTFEPFIQRVPVENMVIEFRQPNIVEFYDEYVAARDLLEEKGVKITIDRIFPDTFGLVNLDFIGAKSAKLNWTGAERWRDLRLETLKRMIDLGISMVVSRVDEAAAVELAEKAGVRRFQGFYIDDIIAKRAA